MKNGLFKRIISMLLLVCMLAGLLPVSVFAQPAGQIETTTKAATSYAAQIAALATPYNEAYTPPNNSYANFSADAHYYIVHKASTTKGHLLAMNEEYTAKYYASKDVNISGNSLIDPDLGAAVTIKVSDTNNYRGSIHVEEGLVSRVSGLVDETYVQINRDQPGVWGSRVSDGKWVFLSFQGKISYDSDSWFSLQYVSKQDDSDDDGFAVIYHGADHNTYIDAEMLQLYRVYTQGFELYKAIKSVEGYADGNADGRYPDDLYTTFNNYLADCISTYTTNNTTTDNEAGLKATMDSMAVQLIEYADQLSANITDLNSYIDIPIEILDFRADGMLLEWERGDYGKWNFRSDRTQTGA